MTEETPRLELKSGKRLRSLELKAGTNRLGRTGENDVQIEHASVSSVHCEVVVAEEGVLVRDCGSTNGTFINGERIQEAWLPLEGTLQLGEVELILKPPVPKVVVPDVDFSPPPPPPPLPDGSPSCRIHRRTRADYRCVSCGATFCAECSREIHRVGGRPMRFCPTCDGQCKAIRRAPKRKKKSFFGFLDVFKRSKDPEIEE